MDFACFKRVALFLATYLASTTVNLLLTSTIEIVINGNILADRRYERKYLERKYNELNLQ